MLLACNAFAQTQIATRQIKDAAVTEVKIGLSTNTTNNVSTTKHGFAPVLPNDATKYLDGTGAYTVPPGSGGAVPTGTGFRHVTSGTEDGTAVAVNVSGANITGTMGVGNGGLGVATLTVHGVLIGNTTSAVNVTAAGSSGQPLLSGGASVDPAYGTLGVAYGGTGATSLTNHGVVLGQSTSAVAVTAAGTSGQVLTSNGASADPTFQTAPAATKFIGIYGDGSDGSLTYDGSTTINGDAPAANVYTVNRDVWASAITINNGVTLVIGGHKIFCSGTLTNNGTIKHDGANASTITQGNGASTGTMGINTGGSNGGVGKTVTATGASGAAISASSLSGGTGGTGGNDGSGHNGGAGGVITMTTTTVTPPRAFPLVHILVSAGPFTGGSGGGGGGVFSGSTSGAGGGGGGPLLICAKSIVNTSGSIHANGGNGSAASGTFAGGGGGGGGGLVFLLYDSFTGNVATVTGGTHGNGAGGGSNGNDGGVGTIISLMMNQ